MSLKNQKQLVDYFISQSDKWISAQELADLLSVSTRQIRKYIASINEKCDGFQLIISGPRGYYLDIDKYLDYKEVVDHEKADTPQVRRNYIIQKLISSSDGYNIHDFSDELYVSVPTIEYDLKLIRRTLEDYDLKLQRNKDKLFINGGELEKRSMMRNLILPDSSDNFVLKDEIQLLTIHYHFWDLRKNIQRILAKNNCIFTNDYTLNNIALHIIVSIDRLRNGGKLENKEQSELFEQTMQFQAAKELADYICKTYDVDVNYAELYYLAITISNNSTIVDFNTINISNIDKFINEKYIKLARKILGKVEHVYYLDEFDNDFVVRFTLHINNMFTRIESGYPVRNPLKTKMKTAFPLIYDIAVFIALEFQKECNIILSEDEIGFFALHIGGYFENSLNNGKVTCAFIYADYYDAYKKVVEKISIMFADTLSIKYIVSIGQYKSETIKVDLIISSVDLDFSDRHVIIHPFLTDTDLDSIRLAVTNILNKNRMSALKTYLFNYVSSGLFYKNPGFKDRKDAITKMTEKAVQLGFANSSLTENVFSRETLSDTTFNGIAVPHSLQDDALTSFISFAIMDKPIQWGKDSVNIIALIGINSDSRKIFTEIFDLLIDILSNSKNVKDLVASADYKDFYQRLSKQIEALAQ